jgi:hypothetical protein
VGIGVGVFLIAAGAILTFAVHATLSGVSIQAVGVILMIAGVLGLVVTLTIFAPRRRTGVVATGAVPQRTVVGQPVETVVPTVERRETY